MVYPRKRAKAADPAAQTLISIPAVGVIVALAYVAVIDDPEQLRRSQHGGRLIGVAPQPERFWCK